MAKKPYTIHHPVSPTNEEAADLAAKLNEMKLSEKLRIAKKGDVIKGPVWAFGKGARHREFELEFSVSNDAVPLEEVTKRWGKLIAPVLRDLLDEDEKHKATDPSSTSSDRVRQPKPLERQDV